MKVNGTATIKASIETVWKFLTNPEGVSQCVPGLEEMKVIIPDEKFQAIASVGLGNIKARFTTDVEWLELTAPSLARMKAHGTAPGSAVDVVAEMHLTSESPGHTRLDWQADVSILGTLAALASRMMGSVTDKMAQQFFDCVKAKIED